MRAAARWATALFALAASAASALADSCAKSRDHILASPPLKLPAEAYKDLYTMCIQTVSLPNVKDAFILREGAVAVVPRIDRIALTAATLAQFCGRFPKGTLHFVTGREQPRLRSTDQAVRIPIGRSTPCSRISGR